MLTDATVLPRKADSLVAVKTITFRWAGPHLRLGRAGPPVMLRPPQVPLREAQEESAATGWAAYATRHSFRTRPKLPPAARPEHQPAPKSAAPEAASWRRTTCSESSAIKSSLLTLQSPRQT